MKKNKLLQDIHTALLEATIVSLLYLLALGYYLS